jgi:pullulanase
MSSIATIQFHYKREREDYENWKLYVHNKKGYGNTFHFVTDKKNPGYVCAVVPLDVLDKMSSQIWFKPYLGDWVTIDERYKRCIHLTDFPHLETLHVYLRQGDPKLYFEKPKLIHTRVNLYYHRYDNDTKDWGISYFLDKNNSYQYPMKPFIDDEEYPLFKKISWDLDYPKDAKELNFYLRKGSEADPVDYRRALLKKNQMDVFMIEGVFQTFETFEEAQKHMEPRILKAVFHNVGPHSSNFNTIWVQTNFPLSEDVIADVSNFSIVSDDKDKCKIQQISYSDDTKRRFQITVKDYSLLPFAHKYNLKIGINVPANGSSGKKQFTPPCRISISRLFDRDDFNLKFCRLDQDIAENLGFTLFNDSCEFKLWCPTADRVLLQIYDSAHADEPSKIYTMNEHDGFWFMVFDFGSCQTLMNKFYTYRIVEETQSYEVLDPYTKACSLNAQKSAILDLSETDPTGFKTHQRPQGPLENPIVYEFHIKDLTMGNGSDVSLPYQGKYLGVIEKIPYLKTLGINCVQILPVTKFESDETREDGGGYNWGYDQTGLWFLPEGIYASDAADPKSRIREFKEMVMAFHENGIRVVMDAVHNHTYETENSIFNQILWGYYYRQAWDDSFTNGSGCGNELKTERPMVRKLVADSLKYWVEEMGLDGFRFDLMSLTDKFTMEKIKRDLDDLRPHILLYGEAYKMGWSSLPYHLQSAKENLLTKELDGIGAFTDVGSRNAIRGYNQEGGLSNGGSIESRLSHWFYVGQKAEFLDLEGQNNPTSTAYNYVDIHDDILLIDQLELPHMNLTKTEILQRYKLAYSILFNYIGPLVLKAGTELLTTKYGDHNSYRTEGVNLIDWHRGDEFQSIYQYFYQYIHFRKSHPAYVMRREEVNRKLEIFDSHKGYVKGKMFKDHANDDPLEKILIYHNLTKSEQQLPLPYEKQGWAILSNAHICGNTRLGFPIKNKVILPPLTTIILCDNKSMDTLSKEVQT